MRQKNEREDQGEGVEDSGKTGTGVWGRDTVIEEGTGKYIGGRRSVDARGDEKWRNRIDNKVGEISRNTQVEVSWECDAKRGRLCKEGDASGSTGEEEAYIVIRRLHI